MLQFNNDTKNSKLFGFANDDKKEKLNDTSYQMADPPLPKTRRSRDGGR